MGGTTGDTTKSSSVSGGALAANPNTFAGSRSAAASSPQASDFSSWLSSIPGWANNAPASANSVLGGNPLLSNPTATATAANMAPPAEFNHVGYQPTSTDLAHIGAPDRVIPAAAPAATAAAAPTTSPGDWLYPGDLPMNTLGQGWGATPVGGKSGWGAVGGFGGVAGYGPGLRKEQILPAMAAGTKLEGADVDQRNRVTRADYDRYMQLYGVGYDKPAYERAMSDEMMRRQVSMLSQPGGGG